MRANFVTEYKSNTPYNMVRAYGDDTMHVWLDNMYAVSFGDVTDEERKLPHEWWIARARAVILLEA